MALRRVLLIVNPASRRGKHVREHVIQAFVKEGISPDVRLTEAPGHAAIIAATEGNAYDAVFTLGGDGTAMEVIGALAAHGPPVGVLGGGTGNVIVRSLGIPVGIARAVHALVNGEEALIDLGRLGDGRRFAIGLGVGIDASMIAETPAKLKQRLGILAYIIVGVRSVLRFERFQARVTVDGEVFEREATAILVANFGTLLHRLITLGEGIRHDDGLLDVCVFTPETFWDSLRITWRLMTRNFKADPCMYYRAGREITVESNPPMQTQADGELMGFTPVHITVEPLAGRLLLPRP